jgi:hypothetical protein
MAAGLRAREHRALAFLVANPSVDGATLARQAGYHPAGGSRLLRRLRPEADRRRRKAAPLGKVGTGEQLAHWNAGTEPGKVDPQHALKWWYAARADLHDLELRWRDPSKLERQKAHRALTKARADYERATINTVRIYESHGIPTPPDLLAGRASGTTQFTGQDDLVDVEESVAESVGASAKPTNDPLRELRPVRCEKCLGVITEEPRYGLVGGGRGWGVVGMRPVCDCHADVTVYATERSRQLAMSAQVTILGSVGDTRPPLWWAGRPYGADFDPFRDF